MFGAVYDPEDTVELSFPLLVVFNSQRPPSMVGV